MLTVVLLAASVSAGRAFVHLMKIDRGFNVKSLVTVGVSLEGTRHQLDNRELPFFEDALARVRRLPGVRSASATEFLPLYTNGFVGGPFGLDGHPPKLNSTMIPILSDYFATMGGKILAGREFTDAEVRSRARVAVVNERFARDFGTPMEVTGRQLTLERQPPWTIVGVVKGMEYETDPSLAHGKQVFVPSQTPGGFLSTIVVRVRGRAEDQLASIRDTIRSVDPQVPLFSAKTMEQRLADLYARPKFYRSALWMLAAFAALLAVIGIYGIVSYAVVQRTREIGVRIAMGTTPRKIRIMLLRQGLLMVVAGAIPGIVIAQLFGQFLRSVVEGAKPLDPAASIGVVLSLVFVAAAGIWSASGRITGLDIAATLRVE
jgi:ABC-type antimicrobial peptide transport system permease subunit